MGASDNPMLITAALLLDRHLDHEALEARLEARLAHYPRFREAVVESRLGFGMPRWIEDRTFDVRNHVHRIDTSLLPGARSVDELVGDLASIPLSRRRPLWRVHVIDGPSPAIVFVVNHALADGTALLSLLAELVDESLPAPATRPSKWGGVSSLRERARRVAAGALAAGRLASMRADPDTPLRGRVGPRKHLAFSRALPLEELRRTAHALETTVTGVLLAAVAGACRTEVASMIPRGNRVIHALVPIDVPRTASMSRRPLGNHFGSAFVPLPVGTEDIASRVRAARAAARSLQSRRAGIAGARLAAAAGGLSALVERLGVEFFSKRASVVVSSIRGPERALHVCDAAVRDVIVWSPSPGSIALGVTLMSYAGHVRIGVAADAHVVGDARRVVRELESEIARLSTFASSSGAYTAEE
jgi:WS/DGAT/MGAT family acyltransferase